MSLFSDLAKTALGALSGSNTSGNPLEHILGELITNHGSGNGLSGLLQQLNAGGLGVQTSSWVGSGENQPVTGAQIHQALGPEQISAFAQKVGLPPGQIADALAQYLPQVIDRLTPHSQLPESASVASALGGLLQSDIFKGLTGAK